MDTSEWSLPTIFDDFARQLRSKAEMNHFFNTNQPDLDAFADSFRPKPKWTISSIETKKELNGVSSWSHDLKPTIILASPRSEVSFAQPVRYILCISAQKQLPEPQEHAKSSKTLEKDHSEVSIGHGISKLKCGDQWTPPSGLFRVFLMILLKCGDQWTPPSGLCRRFLMISARSSHPKPK